MIVLLNARTGCLNRIQVPLEIEVGIDQLGELSRIHALVCRSHLATSSAQRQSVGDPFNNGSKGISSAPFAVHTA